MNKIVAFFGLLAISSILAGPLKEHRTWTALPAIEHEEKHDEYGQFALRYSTADGTIVSERGRLVPTADRTDYVMVLEGEVLYIGDDGKPYITKYTAGPDGYHAEGNHLPVALAVSAP